MIGHTSSAGGSVSAATVPAAIAAVTSIDGTGITPAVVLARSAIRLARRQAGNAEQAGDCGTYDKDPNHPDKNLAQILAPSAVDTLKGNQR
ncbi:MULTISPECIES: hypothetical protein [unclassified Ensifer]|uniref:hypothetical protein n=1 Tax=unclassified Ensifer TaxID=2633371 RepID=UPI0008131E1E|nr:MULTISPECIES: hypothetical protein [unclassified Ensifer]OCP02796.1 hypothetical protein BC362_02690 [Ensifer sp. LC14]OCP13697.1 hypothetical protein BC374_12730 [Ensifer sp. LC13]OCP29060.1 hypothetical protein BC364_11130 [Ensifer sp. LC499]